MFRYRGPWQQKETEFGETFYFNRTTGDKQWERPEGMAPLQYKRDMPVQCRFQVRARRTVRAGCACVILVCWV